MCALGPNTIFAVYSDDERSRKTVGTGYDLEEGMRGIRLGIFSYGIITNMFELIEEINSVLVFYTCPKKSNNKDDFVTIMDETLSNHGSDVMWKWVIDADGFGIAQAGEIPLALRIINLIKTKYSYGLTQVEIVNPTWQVHTTLFVIKPFLEEHIIEKIRIREGTVDYENRF